jgi:hypothetical protein
MMFKVMLIAGAIVFAGSTAPALAESQSHASLRARCDQALAAQGKADASTAVRERCVAILRRMEKKRTAGKRPANCYTYRDPNHRGWSMTAHGFNAMEARGLKPCPG